MTEALNRVIEEQQKRIDDLLEGNKKLTERAANVLKKMMNYSKPLPV